MWVYCYQFDGSEMSTPEFETRFQNPVFFFVCAMLIGFISTLPVLEAIEAVGQAARYILLVA